MSSLSLEPLRAVAALFDLTGRASVELLGKDRVEFLHGLVTNEIKKLPEGSGCRAALLTPKGKMLADLVVLKLVDRLVVDAEPAFAPTLEGLLRKYLFYQDVEIRNETESTAVLHLEGPRAAEVLTHAGAKEAPGKPHVHVPSTIAGVPLLLVAESRGGEAGFDLRLPRALVADVSNALTAAGAAPSSLDLLESARIESGIARWGFDLDESVLPNEAWLERDAISYTKGCYIGQEIVARIKTYGHVNRHLVGLVLPPGAAPERGAEIRHGEDKVGTITSVTRSARFGKTVALGYVKRDHEAPGTELSVGSAREPASVTAFPVG